MANSRDQADRREYATVNTAPAAAGYGTVKVNPWRKETNKVYFSVRETGDSDVFTATVTLQFQCKGDEEWQDYATYTAVDRVIVEDQAAGVVWRAIIKQGDYTEGEVTFGFDW